MKIPTQNFFYKLSITLLYLVALSPVGVVAEKATAFEIGAGMAAVEEGDDRLRPALSIHGAYNAFYAGRIYYYGREFGPIKETSILVSAHRRFPLFQTEIILAQLGVAILDESTKISYSKSADKGNNEEEHNMNIGGAAGISVRLPQSMAPFYAHFSWDSHVFPAGLGGVLLSTGRKQTLSLAAGMTF